MATRFNFKPFLAPRYWPTWLSLGVLRLCTLLPFAWQMWLGRQIGYLSYKLIPRRRHIVATNIRLAFPELDATQQQQLIEKTFASVGMGIFETAMAWWGSQKRLEPMARIIGLENLHEALGEGHGVILLSAHFSSLELGGRMLSFKQPFQVTYKRSRDPLIEAVLKHSREKHFLGAINTYDVRGMVKGLKENLVTWYAMDQDFGLKQSVFAPFMGVSTSTLTTAARLARMSGAVVVPYFPRRLDDNKSYELTILPALQNFPSGDDVADATRINELISDAVRKAPEQYLWVHRRFKTRPAGEADLYQID